MAHDADTRTKIPGPGAFPAFRHRNYRLFFIGQFISMCGTWVQSVAQGWLVWQLSKDPVVVGAVIAAGSVPMLLLSLAGGTAADRVDRRRLLLVTQALSMVLAGLLGLLALQPHIQAWHIGAVAALMGAVSAFDVPTRQAFVVEMVDREALMSAVALNSTIFNGARIVGPALAGVLMAVPWIGAAGCFFLNAASYIGAIIALWLIRVPESRRSTPSGGALSQALAGLRYVRDTGVVRRLVVMMFVVGVFGWSIGGLLPPMADLVLKGDAGAYGWLLTAQGIGAVAGSLGLAGLGDTPYKRALVYWGLVLFCAALYAFSLSRLLPLSAVLLGISGLGMILFSTTSNTVVQTLVPDELRGRVMGIWALIFAGSTPFGSLQAGALARLWGAPAAIQVGVAAMALCGTLVFLNSQRERALRR